MTVCSSDFDISDLQKVFCMTGWKPSLKSYPGMRRASWLRIILLAFLVTTVTGIAQADIGRGISPSPPKASFANGKAKELRRTDSMAWDGSGQGEEGATSAKRRRVASFIPPVVDVPRSRDPARTGALSPARSHNNKINGASMLGAGGLRKRVPAPSPPLRGRLTRLFDFLRGGGSGDGFTSSKRWQGGIDVSSTTAVVIALGSLALVSTSLHPVWVAGGASMTRSYWLARVVVLRLLGMVYFVAFTAAFRQNGALLGEGGLLPVSLWMKRARESMGCEEGKINWGLIRSYPTLLWLAGEGRVDTWMRRVSLAGMLLSAVVTLLGGSNVFVQLALWVLYHSINTVGQRWYGFGWESQLLETGFISIFMVPLLSMAQLPAGHPTPWVTVWAYRWLILRIMLGSGMIKMRGDSCWRDLTAMCFHYETQPVPNPFSWFLHHSPLKVHKFETMANHVVELLAPFLLLMPWQALRVPGGVIQILFQVTLIMSGNLSFLNWLTIIPSVMSLDDAFLATFFPKAIGGAVQTLNQVGDLKLTPLACGREALYLGLLAVIIKLSVPVIKNILSSHQMMNTSFDPLKLVNTYGAFGSITRNRDEIILQGTHGTPVHGQEVVWREYEFKVKPGSLKRMPKWISPYHYRLDWLMWFLPFSDSRRHPWLYHLVAKLLCNDKGATELIERNPFEGEAPPKYIRCEIYRYEYTKPGSEEAKRGDWWQRRKVGSYLRAMSLDDVAQVCADFDWPDPREHDNVRKLAHTNAS